MSSSKLVSLGQIVRARRRELDLTQKEVSKRINTTLSFVSVLEAGKRRPSETTMVRLAKVLDLDERELFFLAQKSAHPILNPALDNPVLSAWKQFKNDYRLRRLHRITEAEMGWLSCVASLGEVRSARDFLYVLNAVRHAIGR